MSCLSESINRLDVLLPHDKDFEMAIDLEATWRKVEEGCLSTQREIDRTDALARQSNPNPGGVIDELRQIALSGHATFVVLGVAGQERQRLRVAPLSVIPIA